MTYRTNPFLDREHPAHVRFDIHEEGHQLDLEQCGLCHEYFDRHDLWLNEILDERICDACSAEWDATHCTGCGKKMPLDFRSVKLSDVCEACEREARE